MFVLLLILLLTPNIGYALQCITNCSLGAYLFSQKFNIPDGKCQQRVSKSVCSILMTFDYHTNLYYVTFSSLIESVDYFIISSLPYLSYSINYQCSKQTDCVLQYGTNRIDEMVGRAYNARDIYGQLAPIIGNSLKNTSIQCYNMKNEIVICSSDEICSIDFDQLENRIISRDCKQSYGPRVYVYDREDRVKLE
ncbi:unnamed protein product, partial [Rotaria sordida]